MSRPLSAAALVAALFLAPRVAADEADSKKKEKPIPAFGTEVSIVALPVFVSNKSGHAVRGLTAADFEILDDGKPVPIVSFQYVDTTSDESQAEIRQVPAARRHFMLLFDMSFTDPGGVHKARVAAKEFVRRNLAESDIAAVATFDVNRGIRVIANFTDDRALLSHAVDTLGVPSMTKISDPLGLFADAPAADLQGGGQAAFNDASNDAMQAVLVSLARRMREADQQRYRQQVMGLIGSMGELAKGLSLVQGRKQVIYFSAGFDHRALVGQQGDESRRTAEAVVEGRIWDVDPFTRFGDSRLRDVMGEMTRDLSRADCVVHSIDVTGLGSDNSLTQIDVTRDPVRDPGGREALHFMANETGGRFFKDTNDLSQSLGEVLDMTSRYYILGYQPNDLAGPGRFHKVKVKVARKNANVSHRAGFTERAPAKMQTVLQRKFETAQLVMTGAGENKLKFSALALPFPAAGEQQTLGLVVQVPMEEIRRNGGASTVPLEIFGYAIDGDGVARDHVAQLARIDLDQADPKRAAKGVSFFGTLRVPAGQYTLKLMVRQTETDQAGVQFLDVTVPPHDPTVGFLLPPILAEEPAAWLGLPMADRSAGGPAFPYTIEGQPFFPRATFRVRNDTIERLVLIAYDPELPKDPVSNVEIRSSVVDSNGAQQPAGDLRIDRVLKDADGRRTYLLNFRPRGLAPGDYRFKIGVGESGLLMESYALLRVESEPPPATAR